MSGNKPFLLQTLPTHTQASKTPSAITFMKIICENGVGLLGFSSPANNSSENTATQTIAVNIANLINWVGCFFITRPPFRFDAAVLQRAV